MPKYLGGTISKSTGRKALNLKIKRDFGIVSKTPGLKNQRTAFVPVAMVSAFVLVKYVGIKPHLPYIVYQMEY